jgi:hypothetical protein
MGRVISNKLRCSLAILAVSLLNGYAAPDHSRDDAAPPGSAPLPQSTEPVATSGTLKPVFAWSPQQKPGLSYDLIICVAVVNKDGFWVPGKTAYYREGLTKPTHALDQPLLPNTVYVWSVRSRSGKTTSKWSAYNDSNPSLFPKNQFHYDIFWPFKTPGN